MNDIFLGQKLKEINYQINEDVDEFSTTIEELIDDYSVEDVLETIAAICSDKRIIIMRYRATMTQVRLGGKKLVKNFDSLLTRINRCCKRAELNKLEAKRCK